MKLLSLDISTNTGYALLDMERGIPLLWGNVWNEEKIETFAPYPYSYLFAAEAIAGTIYDIVVRHNPDQIVIEETNKGKNRYTQKILEFLHCCVLKKFAECTISRNIFYISTSVWRQKVGIELTKEQKKANAKLSKAKSKAGGKLTYDQKKALGLKGRTTKKHVAVEVANARFGLQLLQKDNDIAEAIMLGIAFIEGAALANGK